jgi:hypothetical protein
MHFEILVEDQLGANALNVLVGKIIGAAHTFRVHAYKGIGNIPKNMRGKIDPAKRILLDQLPRILKGYGKSSPSNVIVIVDLDKRCLKKFRKELLKILDTCNPKPETRFCIAVEEGEAWLLGDRTAIKKAYPKSKETILLSYRNDSICGTWEMLANAVCSGGASELLKKGYQVIGKTKCEWAEKIAPHMDIDANLSPSFQYFRAKLLELARRVQNP